MVTGGAEGVGPDAEGVAHERIVKALQQVPDVQVWDDPFEMAADVALDALLAMPVEQRMEAMGMRRILDFDDPEGGICDDLWTENRL